MDVFALRDQVVSDYRRYIESFLRIQDERIATFVNSRFDAGDLWPEPILQLNPAYAPGPVLPNLGKAGELDPLTARFFRRRDGQPLRLYQHQYEALQVAKRWESYLVTTGTGSGKTLTYLIPIYDHVVRTNSKQANVRAIIVYPMNALINSQFDALSQYARGCPDSPVRFDKYTGQERDEARDRILQNPPHILLTNYVMLEYMLLRPTERHFFDRTLAGNVEFLVLDELHTYRGRQGADVAMLVRRLRERLANPRLLCIGTSATLVSGTTRPEQRQRAAAAATQLFGVEMKPENVIDETLRRAVRVPVPSTPEALRAAMVDPLPVVSAPSIPQDLDTLRHLPMAAWVEDTFGITEEDGRLVRRRPPITFAEGFRQLAKQSGLTEEACIERLKAVLDLGNRVRDEDGEPAFAFRLHQFLSGGGSLYATLQPSEGRYLTLEGGYYAPTDPSFLLYPIAFCRECGQEYYLVSKGGPEDSPQMRPDEPFLDPVEEGSGSGYFAVDQDGLWSEGDNKSELPDHWYVETAGGRRIQADFRPHVPRQLVVAPNGRISSPDQQGQDQGTVAGWFVPRPFLVCLRCGIAYERRERSDFRKLTLLNHTGRSTATSLVTATATAALREDASVEATARKLLSFTDNRQDASLQAGHFNDFVQVALIRAGLVRAMQQRGSLDHATVAAAVFEAMQLPQEVYAKEPAPYGPGRSRNEAALRLLLEYRIYEDLRRGWRIIQPNLEQCGLLQLEYVGLTELSADPRPWAGHPLLAAAAPERRATIVRVLLDHLRKELGISADVLAPDRQAEVKRRVMADLKSPWAFDEAEPLIPARHFLLPGSGSPEGYREASLGPTSLLGRYLRRGELWGRRQQIDTKEYAALLEALVAALRGQFLTAILSPISGRPSIQLIGSTLRWALGNGTPAPPDPLRTRFTPNARLLDQERRANAFYAHLYREAAVRLTGVEGREHTAQVPADLRAQREQLFRDGGLAALFSSPTMELGIDIIDLSVVHLRNVPPTPANYAQRSGRAGRGGKPALVITFCGQGSPHDAYFFRRRDQMVAGAVAPARLDLGNPELVRAHIHSLWLADLGIRLGKSMAEILDLTPGTDFPLVADLQAKLADAARHLPTLRARSALIVEACGPDLLQAPWYHASWLDEVLSAAPRQFDAAFSRWRDLYASATRQRDDARAVIDNHATKPRQREEATRQEQEAKRQIDLLLNRTEQYAESDFYPYRYLASEGFIPGYNFPRLPVRALLPYEHAVHTVDRPRFLALEEFGPQNIIYHEGRKYRIARCWLPPGGLEQRFIQARLCTVCGYFHTGDRLLADHCDHCGTVLNAEHSEYVPTLFELTTVYGRQAQRITCDEEIRVRQGFVTSTYFRFAVGPDGQPLVENGSVATNGSELLRLTYAPQATLWRLNDRWRRAREIGFKLDLTTGRWGRRPDEDPTESDVEGPTVQAGVRPFVRDTRTLMLCQVRRGNGGDGQAPDEAFLLSLGYALQRGIQVRYQVEERELAIEPVGTGGNRRMSSGRRQRGAPAS